MDKETGEPVIDANGNEVTSKETFTPDAADGSVTMKFTFDGSDLAGTAIVAFETVQYKDKDVFVHSDLNDADQTVFIPSVGTNATDGEDKTLATSGSVTVVDEVSYKNLIPGRKYVITGVLMSKKTGKPAQAGGKEITGRTTFTPDKKNGTELVTFTFNVSNLDAGEYVVFEELYEVTTGGQVLVGSHKDINDEAQTVTRPANPGKPGKPRTGDANNMFVWLFAGTAALAGIIAVLVKRRQNR